MRGFLIKTQRQNVVEFWSAWCNHKQWIWLLQSGSCKQNVQCEKNQSLWMWKFDETFWKKAIKSFLKWQWVRGEKIFWKRVVKQPLKWQWVKGVWSYGIFIAELKSIGRKIRPFVYRRGGNPPPHKTHSQNGNVPSICSLTFKRTPCFGATLVYPVSGYTTALNQGGGCRWSTDPVLGWVEKITERIVGRVSEHIYQPF